MQMETEVTYEFWDNGYLYVKGKGRIKDRQYGFSLRDYVDKEFLSTIHTLVVEEGITYMGAETLMGVYGVKECWLPSTLTGIHNDCTISHNNYTVVHGYYQGRAVTITPGEQPWFAFAFFEYIEDPEWAKDCDLTITWEE